MSSTFNTQAIVVRREDWKSHDARVTLFTHDRGKVEAVAKGLRKGKSKLAAHLEPFMETEVFVVEGRHYPILAGSSVHHRHPVITQSLDKLSAGGLVMRLVDLMTPVESQESAIFSLLHETLAVFEEHPGSAQDHRRVAHLFAWKLLGISGYHPELRNCLECNVLVEEPQVFFECRRGGVLHRSCMSASSTGIAVTSAAIKGLAYMVSAPMADALRLRSENGGLTEMTRVIETLVEERFEVGAGGLFWA